MVQCQHNSAKITLLHKICIKHIVTVLAICTQYITATVFIVTLLLYEKSPQWQQYKTTDANILHKVSAF